MALNQISGNMNQYNFARSGYSPQSQASVKYRAQRVRPEQPKPQLGKLILMGPDSAHLASVDPRGEIEKKFAELYDRFKDSLSESAGYLAQGTLELLKIIAGDVKTIMTSDKPFSLTDVVAD